MSANVGMLAAYGIDGDGSTIVALIAEWQAGLAASRPTPPEDVVAGREVFVVTVRMPRNPAHNPHEKVTGVCAWSSECTDSTGEHHTFIARDQFEIDVQTPKAGRVTRVETVYLPPVAALAARTLPETEGWEYLNHVGSLVSRAEYGAVKRRRPAGPWLPVPADGGEQ